jgi:cbb3-type cytochrome oxidase maturation protein
MLLLIPISLLLVVLAIAAFFWAVDHSQFDALDRASLEPLDRPELDPLEPMAPLAKRESDD